MSYSNNMQLQFNIPSGGGTTYIAFTVGSTHTLYLNWGDGSSVIAVTSANHGQKSYSYSSAGIYTVLISGNSPNALSTFGNGITMFYLKSIDTYGGFLPTSLENAFNNNSGSFSSTLQYLAPIPLSVTNLKGLFQTVRNLTLDLSTWDTTNVTNMQQMFTDSLNTNFNIGGWNTSNVTNMYLLFAVSNFNEDVSNWNTTNVTTMNAMFLNNNVFNRPIGNWNVEKVTDMREMFRSASSFNQSLGNWRPKSLNFAANMFSTSTMSVSNINSTLYGWSLTVGLRSNVSIHMYGYYSDPSGTLGYNTLTTSPYNWNFNSSLALAVIGTAPVITSINSAVGSLIVNFNVSTGGTPAPTTYYYSLNQGTYTNANKTTSPITITGLNGTYTVSLIASSLAGNTVASNELSGQTYSIGQAPVINSVVPGASPNTLSVAFTKPVGGFPDPTIYYYSLNGGSYINANTTTSPIVIPNLTNQSYTVTLKATNVAGNTSASTGVTGRPNIIGNAPVINSVVAGTSPNTLSVAFTKPVGGYPDPTIYYYSIDGVNYIDANTTTSPIVIAGLSNQSYTVTLKATNAGGNTSASTGVTGRPNIIGNAPVINSIVPGAYPNTLSVAFTKPVGGYPDPITYYYLIDYPFDEINEYNEQYFVNANTTISPIIIQELSNRTYSIRLLANNAAGNTTLSLPVEARPNIIGEPPVIDSVVPGTSPNTLSVAFTGSTGGYPDPTTYYYSIDGVNYTNANTTTSPIVIAGLSDQSYNVTLIATNAGGNTIPSSSVTGHPNIIGSAPVINSVVPGASPNTLSVSFTGSTGGYPDPTTYYYSLNGGSYINANTTTSPIVIAGLSDQSYNVTLKATNAGGNTSASSSVTGRPNIIGSAPVINSVVPGSSPNTLSVAFTKPVGGYPDPTTYYYSIDGVNYTNANTTTSPIVIAGLSDQSYNVTLKATNAGGNTSVSSSVTGHPNIIGNAPVINSVVAGASPNTISVFFTGSIGGYPDPTTYYYSLNGGSYINANTITSPIVIAGLSNQSYTVTLKATNAGGNTSASSSVTGRPNIIGSAPVINSVVPGSSPNTLSVAFTGSTGGYPDPTTYYYSIDGINYINANTTTSPIVISELSDQSYNVTLKANNAVGNTSASSSVTGRPNVLGSAPVINSVDICGNIVKIFFTGSIGGYPTPDIYYSFNNNTFEQSSSNSSPIIVNVTFVVKSVTLSANSIVGNVISDVYVIQSSWLSESSISNRYKQSYFKGFVDISGGSLILRDSDASFNNELYVGGNLKIGKNASLYNLTVKGDEVVTGTIAVTGNTTLSNANIGNVNIRGIINVTGNTTLSNVTVNSNATFSIAPVMSGANITSTSIPDSALSTNIPLKNGTNTFSDVTTFTGNISANSLIVTPTQLSFLNNVSAGKIGQSQLTNGYVDLSNQTITGEKTFSGNISLANVYLYRTATISTTPTTLSYPLNQTYNITASSDVTITLPTIASGPNIIGVTLNFFKSGSLTSIVTIQSTGSTDKFITNGTIIQSSTFTIPSGTTSAMLIACSGTPNYWTAIGGGGSSTFANIAVNKSSVDAGYVLDVSGNTKIIGNLVVGNGFTVSSGTVSFQNGSISTSAIASGFVDTSTTQTIGGAKTFSTAPVMSGANITSTSIPDSALSTNIPLKNGTNTFSGVTTLTGGLTASGTQTITFGTNAPTMLGTNITFSSGINITGVYLSTTNTLVVTGNASISGNVTAVSYNATSDRRLKTNIQPLRSQWNSILSIEPVSFDWTVDGRTDIGFIAQDVYKSYPHLKPKFRTADPSSNEEEPIDLSGNPMYYTIDYGRMTPFLWQGMKEIMQKLDRLESENNKLIERINVLESR